MLFNYLTHFVLILSELNERDNRSYVKRNNTDICSVKDKKSVCFYTQNITQNVFRVYLYTLYALIGEFIYYSKPGSPDLCNKKMSPKLSPLPKFHILQFVTPVHEVHIL